MQGSNEFLRKLKHPVPDIGDAIRHTKASKYDEHRSWRVTGWLRLTPAEQAKTGDPLLDLLVDTAHQKDGCLFVWCERDDATHVSGDGVAGCMLPIEEVEVIGRVPWTEEQFEYERDCQRKRIGDYVS